MNIVGKKVTLRINDRGPYVDGRDMDLSLASFTSIAERSRGVLRNVTFKRLGDVSLVSQCGDAPRMYQKRITRDVRFNRGVPHTYGVNEELVLRANRFFVIRGITYPGGHFVRMQDFVGKKEKFSFIPSVPGQYIFLIGTGFGREREMRMVVGSC